MPLNLCTETFNLNDLDQAAISERAYTEFQKIKAQNVKRKKYIHMPSKFKFSPFKIFF